MAEMLKENLRRLGLDKDCVVLNMDVIYALPALSRRGDTYDLILMDPPYDMGYVSVTLDLLKQTDGLPRWIVYSCWSIRREEQGLPGFLEPGNVRKQACTETAARIA